MESSTEDVQQQAPPITSTQPEEQQVASAVIQAEAPPSVEQPAALEAAQQDDKAKQLEASANEQKIISPLDDVPVAAATLEAAPAQTVAAAQADSTPASSSTESSGAESAAASPARPPSNLIPDESQQRSTAPSSAYVAPAPPVHFLSIRVLLPIEPYRRPGSTQANDVLITLSAHGNLPSLRRTHYQRIERRGGELALWSLALALSLPGLIIPPPPSAPPILLSPIPGHAHDAATHVHARALAAWFARLLSVPAILRHPATPALVDSEFSYTPLLPSQGPGASAVARRRLEAAQAALRNQGSVSVDVGAGLGLPSGAVTTALSAHGGSGSGSGTGLLASLRGLTGPPSAVTSISGADTDEELVAARAEVTRLELQFRDAGRACDKREEANSALTSAIATLAARLEAYGGLESSRTIPARQGMPEAMQSVANALRGQSAIRDALAAHAFLHLSHTLTQQSYGSRAARDALLTRHSLVDAAHEAAGVALMRRREAEQLRSRAGMIPSERIEAKLEELAEAKETAHHLAQQLAGLSSSLRTSLGAHARATHLDLHEALGAHARGARRANGDLLKDLLGLQRSLRGEPAEPEQEAEPVALSTSAEQGGAVKVGAEATPTSNGVATAADAIRQADADAIKSARSSLEGTVAPAASSLPDTTASATPAASSVPEEAPAPSTPLARSAELTPATTPVVSLDQEVHASSDAPQQPSFDSPPLSSSSTAAFGASSHESPFASSSPLSRSMVSPSRPSPFARSDSTAPRAFTPTASPSKAPLEATQAGSPTPSPFARLQPPSSGAGGMSQSAFLPRGASFYANGAASSDAPAPFTGAAAGGASASTTLNSGQSTWGARSRISASDAARSLAGKF